jgi:serine/threonine protein kinase
LISADLDCERPYYVMPYQYGGAVAQHAGRLLDGQLHTVALQLGQTLARIHALNIYHGDIKPDNILVNPQGNLEVAEPIGQWIRLHLSFFPKSRRYTRILGAGGEKWGSNIQRRGCVFVWTTLYHLLTGRKPQDGQRFNPIVEGYAHLPRICEIISACCNANPVMRPKMAEICLMAQGKTWADILAARKKREDQVIAFSLVTALGVLVALMGKMSSRVA